MDSFSCFQTLPEHIVERIVYFYLSKRDNGLNHSVVSGLSVLHSCHIWRAVFIKETLSFLDLSLCDASKDIIIFPKWPAKLKMPLFPADSLVKNIRIFYKSWQPVIDGTALDIVKSAFRDGTTSFVSARNVDITINIDRDFGTFEALSELGRVLLYLKSLAPNSRSIIFNMQNIESNGPIEQLNEGFKDAVLEFIRGSRDVNIWRLGPLEFFDYLVPKDFVNLTRFYFDCYGDSTVFNTIIRNNAGTLRALYADYEVDYRIDTILYNENRDPIVYPCLESLNIWADKLNDVSRIESHHLHFPALKSFCLSVCDSQCYDMFFNNQKASYQCLNRLELVLVPEYIANAHNSFALSAKQLVNVRTMILEIKYFLDNAYYSNPSESDQANARFISMLASIPTALSHLRICGVIAEDPFIDLVTNRCRLESLQNLEIPNIVLGFGSIITLIRKMPLLVTFNSRIRDEYPSIQGVASESLVQYVKANFYCLGRYITSISLIMTNGDSGSLANYYMAIALLVIVCPRLASILKYGSLFCQFKTELLKISQTDEFSEFSDHLELLARNIAA